MSLTRIIPLQYKHNLGIVTLSKKMSASSQWNFVLHRKNLIHHICYNTISTET